MAADPQALHATLASLTVLMVAAEQQAGQQGGPAHALRAALELHKPQDTYPSGRPIGQTLCFGCDLEGFDAEHPEWPCSTFKVISSALGVTTDG